MEEGIRTGLEGWGVLKEPRGHSRQGWPSLRSCQGGDGGELWGSRAVANGYGDASGGSRSESGIRPGEGGLRAAGRGAGGRRREGRTSVGDGSDAVSCSSSVTRDEAGEARGPEARSLWGSWLPWLVRALVLAPGGASPERW